MNATRGSTVFRLCLIPLTPLTPARQLNEQQCNRAATFDMNTSATLLEMELLPATPMSTLF